MAYRTNGGSSQRQLTWVDRAGALQGTVGPLEESLSEPRLSPVGGQVAFTLTAQGKTDIWLQDGERRSRVTFGSGNSRTPVWSPDGSKLAFPYEDSEANGFYQKRADGAGAQESLLINDRPKFLTSWSKDGYLLYFWVNERTHLNLSVLPLTGAKEPFVFLSNNLRNAWPMFSPDGQWVAYHSNATGNFEIYVRPFVKPGAAAQDAQWQVSTTGGAWPVWSADGRELFFMDAAGMMMAAPITLIQNWNPGSTGRRPP